MVSILPSHVGFEGVTFRVLSDRDGGYPDWSQPPTRPVFHIPNSNRSVVQHMGRGLATLTLRIELDSMDDYRSLAALQGTTGTLTLLAGFTVAVGGDPYHLDGRDYEDLSGVELVDLANRVIAIGAEYVTCDAVFSRAMDPLTGEAA